MSEAFNPFIGYVFSNNFDVKNMDKPLINVVAGNGIFEVRESSIMNVYKKTSEVGIAGLPNLTEDISMKIPKLPFSIFNTIVAFTRKIYSQDKTESSIMVFYNKQDNQFKMFVPLQENSGAASAYKRHDDPEYVKMLAEGNDLVMVAHSHPWLGSPSPSGTDEADEKECLLYLIVGSVESNTPTFYLSTCPGAKRQKLKFFDVFECPMIVEGNERISNLLSIYMPENQIVNEFFSVEGIEIPTSWMKVCTKKAYAATPVTSYYSKKQSSYYSDYNSDYYSAYSDYNNYYDKEVSLEDQSQGDSGPSTIATSRYLHKEPVASFAVGDIVDILLDIDDMSFAKVFITLMKEKRKLMERCMRPFVNKSKNNQGRKQKGGKP